MTKQHLYDSLYVSVAQAMAKMSYARRLKVGAVIESAGAIISHGWNGMPAGMDNNCELEENGVLVTRPECMHAEANALDKITRSNMSSVGATLYLTHSPCLACSKQIFNSGIFRVVYNQDYRSNDGVQNLRDRGVTVDKWQPLFPFSELTAA